MKAIARILKLFYAEARKRDGTFYSKTTLTGRRFGRNRHYMFPFDIDIMNGEAFTYANKGFDAKCVELKRISFAKIEHTTPILEYIFQKVYEGAVFDVDNSTKLRNKVFVMVMLYFCRRGRQDVCQLKKTDFQWNIYVSKKQVRLQNKSRVNKNMR